MAAEMSLSKLKQTTLKVSRGHTYTYYTSPARDSKPTILLFHGWPDTAALFAGLINNYLIPAGYGEIFGYGIYYYWKLFTADDGSQIERDNIESVYSVAFGDPHTWKQNWTTKDGMRNWLTAGKTQPTLPFAQGEHKRDFVDRLSVPGAFEAANNWYKSMTFGVQHEAEKTIRSNPKVEVPTLFWGGEQDFVCRVEAIGPVEDAGLIPDLTKMSREGGHWALLEKPKEFGEDVVGWLGKTFREGVSGGAGGRGG
ncbi:uncharacterized protein AB675_5482 [Cyphellophora attinorum]|uniref:AB hydrolase-1 domain-containing protein n=1 Tax=Cyphellophora attinorum TaxID=1664694 RepID=A0A0N1H6S2_9EURO|nr:uncharacterized protein AB675_5482 [Phialophora attinorum]KPI41855.1 hypothetical protein AB675_5482 [Phialophora attinorum]